MFPKNRKIISVFHGGNYLLERHEFYNRLVATSKEALYRC